MHTEEAVLTVIRLFVILAAPCTLGVLVVAVLVGMFQAATTIQDKVIGYVARLGALLTAIYFTLPDAIRALEELALSVLR